MGKLLVELEGVNTDYLSKIIQELIVEDEIKNDTMEILTKPEGVSEFDWLDDMIIRDLIFGDKFNIYVDYVSRIGEEYIRRNFGDEIIIWRGHLYRDRWGTTNNFAFSSTSNYEIKSTYCVIARNIDPKVQSYENR